MGAEYSDAKRKLLEKYLRGEFGAASGNPADSPSARRRANSAFACAGAGLGSCATGSRGSALQRTGNHSLLWTRWTSPRSSAVSTKFSAAMKPGEPVSSWWMDSRFRRSPSNFPFRFRSSICETFRKTSVMPPPWRWQPPMRRCLLTSERLRFSAPAWFAWRTKNIVCISLSATSFSTAWLSTESFFRNWARFTRHIPPESPLPCPNWRFSIPITRRGSAKRLRARLWRRDVEYWREKFSGPLPEMYLATDRPHPRSQTFRGSMYPFRLNGRLTTELRTFCRREGVSLFHALLAVSQPCFTVIRARKGFLSEALLRAAIVPRPRRCSDIF